MDKVYNKLVRDNIPSIIENDGCKCVIKILNEKEYKVELYIRGFKIYCDIK